MCLLSVLPGAPPPVPAPGLYGCTGGPAPPTGAVLGVGCGRGGLGAGLARRGSRPASVSPAVKQGGKASVRAPESRGGRGPQLAGSGRGALSAAAGPAPKEAA